jgi:hypothetical protein
MPSLDDFKTRRPKYTVLLNGLFGAGKTLQAHSFPKCYTLSVDPDGLEVLRQPKNERFLSNLVWFEELNADGKNDLKALFDEKAGTDNHASLYGCLRHAAELGKTGEVETLVIDGGTYLVGLLWDKITQFEEARSEKTGNVDRMAMYRSLGIQLQRLFASSILTMATRAQLNVVVTFHLKRESGESLEGSENPRTGKKSARALTMDSDLSINIEGGFRNKIEGLFGGSLYLERKLVQDRVTGKPSISYRALCDLTTGFDTIINAKTRWGLPARLDLGTKTLYESLTEALVRKEVASAKP